MQLNSGNYNKRVQILKFDADARDSSGFPLPEDQRFIEWRKAWANVETVSGRDYYQAASIQAENEVHFKVRYNQFTKQINKQMRLKLHSKMYEIKTILHDNESKKTITIVARERV
ncbi:head-tail adaptor protein [Alkalihalophilus marmarensis DSM 21297]|uniref:Head-tail adaptor protein n=2 Tax=Alkalihalophilus TaxID=2893060 RepID=U6SR52_9BACI|nr:head-tail adaptor protein [Alkalihalophilus marmarensis DSM 21297]